jgi:hypothetical protein
MKDNYDDIILKYLSDLLDDDEKNRFEKELKINKELKNRFELVCQKMDGIKNLNQIDSDPGYLIGLVPKIHERIDSRSGTYSPSLIQKAIGVGLAVLLVLVLLLPTGDNNVDFNFESVSTEIAKTGNEELNQFVELRYSDMVLYDITSEIDLNNYSDAINTELTYNGDYIYDYDEYANFGLNGISGLSENEVSEIYSSLIDKKIL